MATVAPSADQAAGLLQNLSLDAQSQSNANLDIPQSTNKVPASQLGAVESKDSVNGHLSSNDRCVTPVLSDIMDPSICYLPNSYQHTAYYYGGYDGTCNEWDNYSRYVNQDGAEMPPGVYGNHGSVMYHGFGYAPYGSYSPAGSPVPAIGHDNQLYGHQQYQYPTPYFPPVTPTNSTYTNAPTAPQVEVSSVAVGQTPLPVGTPNGNASAVTNANGMGANASVPFRPAYENSSFTTNVSYSRGGLSGSLAASVPWFDGPILPDGQPRPVTRNISLPSSVSNANSNPSLRNQSLHPHANVMGLHHPRPISGSGAAHGYMNRMYPTKLYGHHDNGVRTGMGFGTGGYDAHVNGRAWFAVDTKYKNKSRGNGFFYGNENMDGLNELNRGPRAKGSKSVKSFASIGLASNGDHDEKANLNLIPDRELYNRPDFPEKYAEAKCFVIKSYSEDDVHKSIKYNVWSSTPNGNKKLDLAFKEAQEKFGGCPVFLFFSVNTSGQFVGLAEMVGPIDFEKNVEYWQQDKWNGSFPVKWHIVKDVPNSLLKHITLENNENKPVTNSRDTQEVKVEQGLQMMKIFKEHTSKTCILDDFGFYEVRQKTIQEKKAKLQQFHKQVWEGKSNGEKNKNGGNEEQQLVKVVDTCADLSNANEASMPIQCNGEARLSDTGMVVKNAEGSKPGVSENGIVNGVTNGC